MASLNVKTEYSEYKDCKLRVGKYVEDNSVAVEIYNRWDGPIARVTTCLCDHSLAEDTSWCAGLHRLRDLISSAKTVLK